MPLNRTPRRVRSEVILSRVEGGYWTRLWQVMPRGQRQRRIMLPW